jgi:hypothetical protein
VSVSSENATAVGAGRRRRVWDVAALLAFVLTTAWLYRPILLDEWSRVVPVVVPADEVSEPGVYPGSPLSETDHQFVVWLVSRNARTLLRQPWRLYDAETCYPSEHALALGEPGVDLGVLGMPAWLLTRDPIATYNAVLVLLPVLSAMAMYWLVARWTAVPGAGLVAGLLYGFHSLKVQDPVHFYVYDTLWLVAALFLAERLFTKKRWGDALALAAVTSMQLAASLYAVLASVLAGIPFLVWLVRRDGLRGQRAAQWATVAVIVLIAAGLLFGPFLQLAGSGEISSRSLQIFRPLAFYLPSQEGFPGWPSLLLVAAAFALPVRRSLAGLRGDPRWALLVGIVLIHVVSIGAVSGDFTVSVIWDGEGWPPNLYMALARVVPGLGLVRAPAAIFNCAVALIALLAGIGAAGVLQSLPERARGAVAVLCAAVVFVDMLRPPALGWHADYTFAAFALRPDQALLDFYDALQQAGNRGPILQVPATPRRPRRESTATLLSAYHRRPIGQCYNSHHTPAVRRVRELSESLPDAAAVAALAELGFTTFVITHGPRDVNGPARRRAWAEAASGPDAPLREIHASGERTAYEIVPRP